MTLRRRVIEYLRSRLASEHLPLRLVLRDGDCFDFSASPSVAITLHSAALLRTLARGDFVRLGGAYAAGEMARRAWVAGGVACCAGLRNTTG